MGGVIRSGYADHPVTSGRRAQRAMTAGANRANSRQCPARSRQPMFEQEGPSTPAPEVAGPESTTQGAPAATEAEEATATPAPSAPAPAPDPAPASAPEPAPASAPEPAPASASDPGPASAP